MKTLTITKTINCLPSKMLALCTMLFILIVSCTDEQLGDEFLESEKQDSNIKSTVAIENPGFESGKVAWGDEEDYQISSDEYSGSRAGKVSDSNSDRIEQTVVIREQTDYILQARVQGDGTLSIGGSSINFDTNNYELVTISFNSGNATSATILGRSNDDDVRFDDFTLESTGVIITPEPQGNLALGKATEQSSIAFSGDPARAVDGNTSGIWSDGSITHTANTSSPWWQVLLGEAYDIEDIVVWNRTNCCSDRLSDFDVIIYNDAGAEVFRTNIEDTPSPSVTVNAGGVTGSIVRIQLSGTNPLSLAEVQVFGAGDEEDQPVDTTPPSAVSDLNAVAGNELVTLSWENPNDNDFENVRITYNGISRITSSENIVIDGLDNGTSYTFNVVAIDSSGNISDNRTVSVELPSQETPIPGGSASDIIGGRSNWKLNGFSGSLSVGNDDNGLDYKDDASMDQSHFFFEDDGYAVFRCYPGSPTGGSSNPRSELREVIDGGDEYWDGTTSTERSMKWRVKIDDLPPSGKLCFGQIHERDDDFDDIIRVQVEGEDGQNSGSVDLRILGYVTEELEGGGRTIDFDMNMDTEYYFELTMRNSVVRLYELNNSGNRVSTLYTSNNVGNARENYFKAGVYLQSTKSSHSESNVYGQVSIKDLEVSPND